MEKAKLFLFEEHTKASKHRGFKNTLEPIFGFFGPTKASKLQPPKPFQSKIISCFSEKAKF